jgi:hypothetical protein
MHDIVRPILLITEHTGIPMVRKDDEGWAIRESLSLDLDEWMPVTFAPTAAALDDMLACGEIVIDEQHTAHVTYGPWGLTHTT